MSEQFEHNIRKKLQDAEVPFEPLAWERMEKLLDAPNRRRPVWWWLGGLVLLLGIGLGGWWFFSQPNVDNARATSESNQHPTSDSLGKNNIVDNRTSSGTNSPSAVKNAPAADDGNSNVDNPANSSASPSANSISKGEKLKNENPDVEKLATNSTSPGYKNAAEKLEGGKRNAVVNKNQADENQRVNNLPFPMAQATTPSQKSNEAKTDVHKPASSSALQNQKPDEINPDPKNPSTPAVTNTQTDSAQTPRDPWKAPRRKGFEGGIHLGPDINATGSFVGTKIGFTGGILLRYHINNRWFISTGAAYTKKIYGASPDEYKSSYPGTYTNIDADCDVIDVPLNIHYVFGEKPSGRWNVSAGASTYFMLREKYDYYYPNYYKRTRVFSNQNQHWFSVINLSAGWEQRTRGRLNWGLQPYVKIPAGGVGEGKVKLYSAGLSLQLTLGKK